MAWFRREPDLGELISERLASGNYRVVQGVFSTPEVAAPPRPDSVFICYRRQDTQWAAVGIRDVLVGALGAGRVFMDIDSIEPGADFTQAIRDALTRCSLVLAMIGPRWMEATRPSGRARIHEPGDYVRHELEVALQLGRRIVPVFVEGARMPSASLLPASLADLVRRNGVELSPLGYKDTVLRLVQALG